MKRYSKPKNFAERCKRAIIEMRDKILQGGDIDIATAIAIVDVDKVIPELGPKLRAMTYDRYCWVMRAALRCGLEAMLSDRFIEEWGVEVCASYRRDMLEILASLNMQ